MDTGPFKPLQEYLDSLPGPKWWQFRTRFILWLSDKIDEHHMKKAERKLKKSKRTENDQNY